MSASRMKWTEEKSQRHGERDEELFVVEDPLLCRKLPAGKSPLLETGVENSVLETRC